MVDAVVRIAKGDAELEDFSDNISTENSKIAYSQMSDSANRILETDTSLDMGDN